LFDPFFGEKIDAFSFLQKI